MIKAKIIRPDNSVLIEFDLPRSLHEVQLSRFIDFLIESRPLQKDADPTAIVILTKAVSAFYGIDSGILFDAAAGLNTGHDSFAGSISQLYGHAAKLIGEFKPSLANGKKAFQYKGDEYHVPTIIEQSIKGEYILADLSVAEVIEVSELSRFRDQATKAKGDPNGSLKVKFDKMVGQKIDELANGGTDEQLKVIDEAARQMYREQVEIDGDPDGSLMYSYYLKLLAVITRRSGEQLPVEDSTREYWIQERAAHFQEIDAATALDVDFFLTDISKSYVNAMRVGGFLKSRCFAVVAAIRLKSAKPGKKASTIRKKSLGKSAGGR
ncbi:MAG: hypothetical protein ACRC1D_03490 [Culicoidibacterales bacterium]